MSKSGVERFSSQLSAQIWGHRFMDGQKGPEYVLEFLNVLYGTEYKFDACQYQRNKSLGLRRFIFEGDKEGAKGKVVSLPEEDKETLYQMASSKEQVDVIREFFKNLEVPLHDGRGKTANRSWYAKTLYPLHESLLFFEVRTKSGDIAYERNFFARGGELYFLMLAYGTADDLALREKIENRLQQLLQKNRAIENIVNKITESLDKGSQPKNNEYFPLTEVEGENKEYPYLPVTDDPMYHEFAKEFYQLISLNIDIYEMFELMTSLITFQLSRYMLNRAKDQEDAKVTYFFDCLDGQLNPIKRLSARSFSDNELLIKNKFESYFMEIFNEKIPSEEYVQENLQNWKDNPEEFMDYLGLKKLSTARKNKVIKVLNTCQNHTDISTNLFNVVKDIVSDQLKKHQLNIVRGLTRDGGFGGYRVGSKYRYFMTDSFLQVLVYSIVKPKSSMEYHDFLKTLYEKFGFIIGEVEARKDGIYETSRINISYFQRNEYALREKLRHNGLLVEYSDATAMIKNPYEEVEMQVVE
ncbi:hypothetical protein [Pontibacillus marinus]|uniref:Uncharacterized protein n=1 Tax=Pontibacillus marinus BH030004 = DSM 16465 TaxID=1385511 RepID=A0A0A5I7P6_9BACI|nr:hypothetical protein [Pontibacillus marinus]KGX91862.1 hypothetical protein N783_00205 [Pontibacillus marinus BH030004 = DSM 16465]